ncbi:hypothetical protein [Algivirga pacifica]|uniref:Outer membrane protein beta-barrel domain-containing protein n=1 Tax=Algivirga pacifica TaxID=1162670 RepID=A0ABP9DI84_9BACT
MKNNQQKPLNVTNLLKTNILLILLSISILGVAQNTPAPKKDNIKIRGIAELGFLGVLGNKVQFGEDGTYINYVKEGGQDVLFPVSRLALELKLKQRHIFTLLYQPLRLESTEVLERDLLIDGIMFPQGTNVDFLYNFPFYRITYLNELLNDNDKFDLAIGGGLQLRNATINFEALDGSLFHSNRDIGPVPVLSIRTRYNLNKVTYTEFEADGFYAPISYINGSDNDVVGAILDASIRQGVHITEEVNGYINLRYLGGGAEGSGDDYVKNWLNFLTVTAGVTYEFPAF